VPHKCKGIGDLALMRVAQAEYPIAGSLQFVTAPGGTPGDNLPWHRIILSYGEAI
jgi:hypothetical protein